MKSQGSSTVHLPIKLSKQDIELTINQLITGVIYEDTNMDKDDMMVLAEKKGFITVDVDVNTFRYRVSLDIWVKKDIGLGVVEASGGLAIEFSTSYEISKEWQISTVTEVSDYVWLEKPKVRVGFFDIPILSIANKIVERSKQLISQSLDHQLSSNFNLRNYVQQGWELLQDPILVSADFNLWFKIYPENLSMTSIAIHDDEISNKVLIRASTNAFIGEKPPSHTIVVLPPFGYSDIEEEGFQIQLPTRISYKELQNLAKQHLIAKTFTTEGRSITIVDIALCGNGDKLEINALLSGSYSGSINLICRPVYNKIKKQIEFEAIDFELDTRNVLFQGIGWLFPKILKRQFEKAMKFPLKESLDKMKGLLQNSLEAFNTNDNVFLKTQFGDIEVHRINLSEESVEVLFLTKGEVSLEIKGIKTTQLANRQ
ncbi:MAG: hypothetical protein ACI8P3_000915 [Saprospiraceae bacterium]|jgi:hypothetical protein